jgi:serine palmitoyltransferase
MVKDWEPESLVPDRRVEEVEEINSTLVVTSAATTHVTIQGYDQPKLNFTTFDFLGLTADKRLKDAARDALNKYGCGSCGPRGFYGTIDVCVKRHSCKVTGLLLILWRRVDLGSC